MLALSCAKTRIWWDDRLECSLVPCAECSRYSMSYAVTFCERNYGQAQSRDLIEGEGMRVVQCHSVRGDYSYTAVLMKVAEAKGRRICWRRPAQRDGRPGRQAQTACERVQEQQQPLWAQVPLCSAVSWARAGRRDRSQARRGAGPRVACAPSPPRAPSDTPRAGQRGRPRSRVAPIPS